MSWTLSAPPVCSPQDEASWRNISSALFLQEHPLPATRAGLNSWASRQLGPFSESPGNSLCHPGHEFLLLCASASHSVKWADAHNVLRLRVSGPVWGVVPSFLGAVQEDPRRDVWMVTCQCARACRPCTDLPAPALFGSVFRPGSVRP